MSRSDDWHVDRLVLQNFRGFSRLDIDFDPSLTVLVGINGVGKTAILDALAVMLSSLLRPLGGPGRGFSLDDVRTVATDLTSSSEIAHIDRQFPVWATATASVAGQVTVWERTRSSASGRTTWGRNADIASIVGGVWESSKGSGAGTPLLPVIGLYGVERLLGVRRAAGAISRSRSGAYDSALEGKSDFARLTSYIKSLTLAEYLAERRGEDADAARRQLRAIALACNAVLDGTGWRDPEWSPVVETLTLTHDEHGTLPLSSLSSGLKIAVGLVLDIASRAARANPSMGAEELLEHVPGIALIDEVDLHLHPVWQQRIITQLRTIFPRVQFVVTTHSPQVLSTVEAKHIRIVDGIEIRGVDYSAGLRSDIVLRKILGTDPEPPLSINSDLDKYMHLVNDGQGDTPPARELRRRLDESLGGVSNVPDLADADAIISLYNLEN